MMKCKLGSYLTLSCITTGTVQQVNKALDMIKRKFPVKRFPGIDYDRCLPDVPVLPADIMQVSRLLAVSNIVSYKKLSVEC